MTDAVEHVEKRGRKTKEEEAWSYLEEIGVTPELVAQLRSAQGGQTPGSFAEMLDLAAADLWANYHSLSGVAKVQAFKAIQSLAKDEGGDAGGGDEPLIADVVAGIVQLPDERRTAILTAALADLDAERARIVELLDV